MLISALAVAFFSSVTTELKASRNFASGVSTRQLADSAISVVMGQIRDATSRDNAAWASQPGMIRVYRSGSSASATADAFFKLYSSNNMVETASGLSDFVSTADYEQNWNNHPAYWTDLNSPVLVRDPLNPSHDGIPRFPIIDPRASGEVEGFDYEANKVALTVAGDADNDSRRLPMPVRWIYVLQDGTLTTPQPGTGLTAKWSEGNYKSPSKENPIVGRIAFWADDETSKVNLNTAGGHIDYSKMPTGTRPAGYDDDTYAGSFWDTPRFYTKFDRGMPYKESMPDPGAGSGPGPGRPKPGGGGLALCQLLQNEFQRYPGHPATTSLGMVFSGLTSNDLYKVLPRLGITNSQGTNPGTSDGGTHRVIKGKDLPTPTADDMQVQPKMDRLYSSVDELLFAAQSGMQSTDDSYVRKTNDDKYQFTDKFTPEEIDKLRFFVTAQSRAPELNLFGQPRVTVWPVRHEADTGTSGLNAFDNVILFCSTVGTTTGSRQNTTTDSSSGVYRYIFTRKEVVPGTDTDSSDGNFKSAYESGPKDIDRPRNVELLKYLKGLTGKNIPGFGGSFDSTAKYGTNNRVALLVEIFDYIRCANSQDTTTSISGGNAIKFAERGLIMPSSPKSSSNLGGSDPRGFGRFPTISEATIVFYYSGPKMDPNSQVGSPPVNNTGWSKWDTTAPGRDQKRFAYIVNKTNGTQIVNPTAQNPGTPVRLMRAFMLFSTFDPMQGYAPFKDPAKDDPKITIEAKWSTDFYAKFSSGEQQLGFPTTATKCEISRAPGGYWGGRNFGGYEGFMHTLVGQDKTASDPKLWAPHKIQIPKVSGTSIVKANISPSSSTDYGETTFSPATKNPFITAEMTNQSWYPFQSLLAVEVPYNHETFEFSGGKVDVRLLYGGMEVQKLTLSFPGYKNAVQGMSTAVWPVPGGDPRTIPSADGKTTADVTTWQFSADQDMRKCYWRSSDANTALKILPTPTGDAKEGLGNWAGTGTFYAGHPSGNLNKPSPYIYETSLQASWLFGTRLAWAMQRSDNPLTVGAGKSVKNYYGDRWRCILQPGDTIKSLIYWDGNNASGSKLNAIGQIKSGDLRVAAVTADVPEANFAPHPLYREKNSRACMLRLGDGTPYFKTATQVLGGTPAKSTIHSTDWSKEGTFGNHVNLGAGTDKFPSNRAFGNLPWWYSGGQDRGVNGILRDDGKPGDFDTGLGSFADGAFCNKQDEGNVIVAYYDSVLQRWIYPVPYFGTWAYEPPGNTYTSPFRQMPSALMMGSLLSRPADGRNWETLAFSPWQPGDTDVKSHPGNTVEPKDHLLLDLFHMPIVEPYPISEPFSTAGKVNLNYKIAPFDYIHRSTALRATLHPVRVTGVSKGDYATYKTGVTATSADDYDLEKGQNAPLTAAYRKTVDRDATIGYKTSEEQGFEKFFAEGKTDPNRGFFKSASQICEMDLYPKGVESAADLKNWWALRTLTGDNVREKPYADLYPRITTKSNTYTVHMRVQTLRQLPRNDANDYARWEEGKDAVLGEYRGATTIERYIDPADPRFSAGHPEAVNPDTDSIEKLYRFRTVVNKKFSPQ